MNLLYALSGLSGFLILVLIILFLILITKPTSKRKNISSDIRKIRDQISSEE